MLAIPLLDPLRRKEPHERRERRIMENLVGRPHHPADGVGHQHFLSRSMCADKRLAPAATRQYQKAVIHPRGCEIALMNGPALRTLEPRIGVHRADGVALHAEAQAAGSLKSLLVGIE